jgi:hypothetical protein
MRGVYSRDFKKFGKPRAAVRDPSDLLHLWKDTAGTVSVTTHGDLVARINSRPRSRRLVRRSVSSQDG